MGGILRRTCELNQFEDLDSIISDRSDSAEKGVS